MIEVQKEIVIIHFDQQGMVLPYEDENRFDPNRPRQEYGQPTEIALLLVCRGEMRTYRMKIPSGALPVYKRRRHKTGSEDSITVGYKIGYNIGGIRKMLFIDIETGNEEYIQDKI